MDGVQDSVITLRLSEGGGTNRKQLKIQEKKSRHSFEIVRISFFLSVWAVRLRRRGSDWLPGRSQVLFKMSQTWTSNIF